MDCVWAFYLSAGYDLIHACKPTVTFKIDINNKGRASLYVILVSKPGPMALMLGHEWYLYHHYYWSASSPARSKVN